MVLVLQSNLHKRVFLAMKFHKRRSNKDFLPQQLTEFAAQFPAARVRRLNAIRDMRIAQEVFYVWHHQQCELGPGANNNGCPKSSTSDHNKQRIVCGFYVTKAHKTTNTLTSSCQTVMRTGLILGFVKKFWLDFCQNAAIFAKTRFAKTQFFLRHPVLVVGSR